MIPQIQLQMGVNGSWKPLGETRTGIKLCAKRVKRVKPIRVKIIDAIIKRNQLVSGRSKIY